MILSVAEFGEIFPIVAVAIAVVLSLASSSVKKLKNQQKQGAKPPIKAESSPAASAAEKTPDEQFDEIVKKMENSSAAAREARMQRKKERQTAQKNRYRFDTRNTVGSSDDTTKKADEKVVNTGTKVEERQLHIHPAEKPVKGQAVKKEKVPKHTGSLGDVNTEGCGDHSDVRYVLDEVKIGAEGVDSDTAELQRLIVWSEILSSPKYKDR